MQSVINSVKGTALAVGEYLTPVLKVNDETLKAFFVFNYYFYLRNPSSKKRVC